MRKAVLSLVLAGLLPLSLGACASAGPHKEAILPPGAQPSALFSPVVRTGNLLFLSGVIGRSDDGNIGTATRQAMDNIRGRLATAGATMDDLVKCTVYLIDMNDYQGMNQAYTGYFTASPPARTAIAVRELPANAQVEVTCVGAAR